MAELILEPVVESITEHLLSLISREVGLASGVKVELQKLQSTLSAIAALLYEAEKRQIQSADVKAWLKNLEDVIYDAKDLLNDFSTQEFRCRSAVGGGNRILNKVGIFFSSPNPLVYASKMAHRVKDIRKRIDAISNDRAHFQLKENSNPIGSLLENRVTRETYPHEPQPYVIGRDKDKKEVIEFLLNPDFEENVSILPIVGFGGLGKTTLARLIFNDDSVKDYFELKLWVCVSTNFDVNDILGKIVRECLANKEISVDPNINELRNLHGKEHNGKVHAKFTNMDALQRKLGEELDGKKFLLVLDDVWNENRREWLKLEWFLMNGAKGSKILVTTRSPLVARTMTGRSHNLSGLAEDDSFSLLMRMAMKQEHEWRNENLESIAKEILKKCAGVPLAITTIGRLLLFSRNMEGDWLKFKNNDLSRINQEEGDIMPSLKLSYSFLPSHLKRCFSYCSLFPKDYRLEPSELIHLWMAQGFIKPLSNRQTIKEAGQNYFMELLSRCFFQDVEEDQYGSIVSCKMHGLLHDLAQSVAGNDCVTIDSSNVKTVPEETRHISIVAAGNYKWNGFHRDRRVRSMLFIDGELEIENGHLDVSGFTNLRALSLHCANVSKISSSIGKLKRLRSLDLSFNYSLRYLPNSISKLCNLETLDLTKCASLRQLPRGITKLVNLRHLIVSGCLSLTHMPRGIEKLTSLETLDVFVVGRKWNSLNVARLNELSGLTGLRTKELTIGGLVRVGSTLSELDASFSIENFPLQSVILDWRFAFLSTSHMLNFLRKGNSEEVLERLRPHPNLKGLRIEGYDGAMFSSWVSQLHRLVQIEIIHCTKCRQLPPLDQLPFLKKVSLQEMSNLESIELWESTGQDDKESGMLQSNNFFPSLEEIELRELPKFRGWERTSRRATRIEREEDDHSSSSSSASCSCSSSSLLMLHILSDKVKVSIEDCPVFSYAHCQQLLQMGLTVTTIKLVEQLQRDASLSHDPPSALNATLLMAAPIPPSRVTMTAVSSKSLSTLTSIFFSGMDGAEDLPVELFRSVPSLKALVISNCRRLKALPVREILRYLPSLEMLEISSCELLDLSMNENSHDGIGEGINNLQLHGHLRLRHIKIKNIHKMETLPGWFQYLSNLENLEIIDCYGLKSLPRRLILPLLTKLVLLKLDGCLHLNFSGESGNQQGMPNLQSSEPTKLRKLEFKLIHKMKTLPWWIQHLNNLEYLGILYCSNLKALPEWFPNLTSLKQLVVCGCGNELTRRCRGKTGEDCPKISHIEEVIVISWAHSFVFNALLSKAMLMASSSASLLAARQLSDTDHRVSLLHDLENSLKLLYYDPGRYLL